MVFKNIRPRNIISYISGMDPAWSGGGGGDALPAVVPSCVGRACRPRLIHYVQQSLTWLLYLSCNCCSQFAYHHVITQITVSHFVSNTILLYHENSTPPQRPLWPRLGVGCAPPSKSIPDIYHTSLSVIYLSIYSFCHTHKRYTFT
jgi:hypothetical protein